VPHTTCEGRAADVSTVIRDNGIALGTTAVALTGTKVEGITVRQRVDAGAGIEPARPLREPGLRAQRSTKTGQIFRFSACCFVRTWLAWVTFDTR
jgi:hypothetical protein